MHTSVTTTCCVTSDLAHQGVNKVSENVLQVSVYMNEEQVCGFQMRSRFLTEKGGASQHVPRLSVINFVFWQLLTHNVFNTKEHPALPSTVPGGRGLSEYSAPFLPSVTKNCLVDYSMCQQNPKKSPLTKVMVWSVLL